MKQAQLFQWIEFKQDVSDSPVKQGDRGVVLDHLSPNSKQPVPGYTIEVFRNGETLDVVSVPVSWVRILPEMWGDLSPATTTKTSNV
jgi:hypothetical protein